MKIHILIATLLWGISLNAQGPYRIYVGAMPLITLKQHRPVTYPALTGIAGEIGIEKKYISKEKRSKKKNYKLSSSCQFRLEKFREFSVFPVDTLLRQLRPNQNSRLPYYHLHKSILAQISLCLKWRILDRHDTQLHLLNLFQIGHLIGGKDVRVFYYSKVDSPYVPTFSLEPKIEGNNAKKQAFLGLQSGLEFRKKLDKRHSMIIASQFNFLPFTGRLQLSLMAGFHYLVAKG